VYFDPLIQIGHLLEFLNTFKMHKMAKNCIICDISAQISIKFNLTIATNSKKSLPKMFSVTFLKKEVDK